MEDAPFRPILDRVLVRRIEAPATADGFGVPEKYRQHSNLGIVIALGDGVVLGYKWRQLTDFLSVGDKVLYGEYTAERWEGDEAYWIVRIQDIRGVVSDPREHRWTKLADPFGRFEVKLDWCPDCNATRPRNE